MCLIKDAPFFQNQKKPQVDEKTYIFFENASLFKTSLFSQRLKMFWIRNVFDTSLVSWPSTEQVTNLVFGIITSASHNFIFRETLEPSSTSRTQTLACCCLCTFALEYGMQFVTKNLRRQPDLASCSQTPWIKLRVSLPPPLTSLSTPFSRFCATRMQKL